MDVELNINAALKSFGDVTEKLTAKKRMTLRRRKVDSVDQPDVWSIMIMKIRKSLKHSQEEFAGLLNVRRETVASWETGRKKPSGPSLRLLQVVEKHPNIVKAAAFAAPAMVSMKYRKAKKGKADERINQRN
jgi:DNA-binding transcriptional regulator YiaG